MKAWDEEHEQREAQMRALADLRNPISPTESDVFSRQGTPELLSRILREKPWALGRFAQQFAGVQPGEAVASLHYRLSHNEPEYRLAIERERERERNPSTPRR